MISLIVPGHAEPEQSRDEIEHRLQKYGVGAVCLLRNGGVATALAEDDGYWSLDMFELDVGEQHFADGLFQEPLEGTLPDHPLDIIRVFPPGTRLRVTVEVVE